MRCAGDPAPRAAVSRTRTGTLQVGHDGVGQTAAGFTAIRKWAVQFHPDGLGGSAADLAHGGAVAYRIALLLAGRFR
ncbi:Ring-hydroxylating dioxygenase, large terminal s ubunit [Mycolicibacterium canariasense]|uniref:Ring-hydroxylating dioxygenase, large terminal s ubunit n=1 Tax=Mycolicibacterium canariasense TaxID=228230 RepID=A0A117IAH2_MYCCR|nr:Ring-hydroxylating dioxygenase, large terminal s ubunit [Mycolicibacterium canariasense]